MTGSDQIRLEVTETENEFEKSSWLDVYKQIYSLAVQATLVFAITFLVYPGNYLDTHFDFLNNSTSANAWFNILMISIFSFGDTVGRALAKPLRVFGPKTIIFFTVGRLIFIATAILVQKNIEPSWLFGSDWFRIVNIWLFAATNGYNTAAVMLLAPEQVKDKDKERVGLIMSFHLIAGVCLATPFAAFLMVKI